MAAGVSDPHIAVRSIGMAFFPIDADKGDSHAELLVFGASHKHRLLVGREHGRTIPLLEIVLAIK
jgi:hypothetical protein